ncbi:MAG: hypothetical protein JNJ70_20195 [Verrucomicrobiales bacterium]|nr:hypothetical protein [Verrucomicrobiales bacterium]
MRTTVSIEDSLLEQARELSRQRSCTLGEVFDEALRLSFAAARKGSSPESSRPLKTFRGDGLRDGVDLDSSSSLQETMDGR